MHFRSEIVGYNVNQQVIGCAASYQRYPLGTDAGANTV